jgi:hypothetical protein
LADETPSTLTQVNAEFLNQRAARMDSAITKALASKLEAPKPPKASAGSKTGSRPAAPSGASPASATSGSMAPDSDTASTSTPDESSSEPSPTAGAEDADASAPAADEPQDGAEAAEQTALDRPALEALAKKKDRRGIEKLIGLPEGALGVGDHEYAAYRRRVDEVEAREATVQATHERNNQTLISKFGGAVEAIERAQKGDLLAYARSIELTTGIRIATFIEHYAKNVQALDPRILQLEQENTRLRNAGRLVTQDGQIEKPAATPEAARKKAETYVTQEAAEHPALKLRGGLGDVRDKWLSSFDKATQSFKLTPKQAADAVVEDRRKAREQEDWVLSGKKPPTKPRTRTVTRQGASETQPRKQNLTREQLIDRAANEWRRQKARA